MATENGYRWYGESQIQRQASIVAYRAYGLPVARIVELLNQASEQPQPQLLRDHFKQLENEICQLRQQQKAIVAALREPELLENNMVSKDRWVEIMKAAGFDKTAMRLWHQKFEEMEPQEHQLFLESLGIGEEEIKHIRQL
ncbi:MerR family transcriptional regulator [Teredinibacter franksiae]|uniref:MerR family transcriptional regulator n=1 Tax=Teredinibacter franksiae TaxID=2761453 RepID=UPI001FED21DC|nr:MerR family transcriptional regulator [Teredinibacter franksiae]